MTKGLRGSTGRTKTNEMGRGLPVNRKVLRSRGREKQRDRYFVEDEMEGNRYQAREDPISFRAAVRPGLIVGLIGGVLMGLVLMLFAFRQGDVFRPMKLIAATLLGENALSGAGLQPGPVLLGMILHFMTAIFFGIFFAWIGGYLTLGAAMGWGVIFGLSVWVIMQYGLLPVINPFLAATPPLPFAIAHVIFGLSLGTYPRYFPPALEIPEARRKAA